jgi:predicted regulator of Ras-like GTPase activity (Roadblock/LC7/MglB family)
VSAGPLSPGPTRRLRRRRITAFTRPGAPRRAGSPSTWPAGGAAPRHDDHVATSRDPHSCTGPLARHNVVMVLADALHGLLRLPGATYACVVERDTGRVLVEAGRGEGDAEGVVPYSVARWGTAVAAMFDTTGDELDDVMIAGRRSYHLVRSLGANASVLAAPRAGPRAEAAAVDLRGRPDRRAVDDPAAGVRRVVVRDAGAGRARPPRAPRRAPGPGGRGGRGPGPARLPAPGAGAGRLPDGPGLDPGARPGPGAAPAGTTGGPARTPRRGPSPHPGRRCTGPARRRTARRCPARRGTPRRSARTAPSPTGLTAPGSTAPGSTAARDGRRARVGPGPSVPASSIGGT